jgi:hypothetical protein
MNCGCGLFISTISAFGVEIEENHENPSGYPVTEPRFEPDTREDHHRYNSLLGSKHNTWCICRPAGMQIKSKCVLSSLSSITCVVLQIQICCCLQIQATVEVRTPRSNDYHRARNLISFYFLYDE